MRQFQNYAKQLHLIHRTVTISLIFKHSSILPFKLHSTKQKGVPFCLCYHPSVPLTLCSLFLTCFSMVIFPGRTYPQEGRPTALSLLKVDFFSKLVPHNIILKYKYTFYLQIDLGATPSLSLDGYLGKKIQTFFQNIYVYLSLQKYNPYCYNEIL